MTTEREAVQYWFDAATERREERDRLRAVVARIGQMADAWEQRLPETIRTPAVVSAIRAVLERAAVPVAAPPTTEQTALRDRIAAAMREHYLCTNREEADADGNLPCRCGDWREPGAEVDDENDWDSHLADAVLAVLPAPVDRAALDDVRKLVRRLAAHAEGFGDVLDDSDRDPWAKTVRADIAALTELLNQAAEAEAPLSPDYEHPECGFHWHGRDGMDIPIRDGQPVCPRCELAKVEKQLAYVQRMRDEVGEECKRRGRIKLEQAERIVRLERELDGVRDQLGKEMLRADEAELRRVAAEEQPAFEATVDTKTPPKAAPKAAEEQPAETQDGDRVKAIADAIGPVMLLGLQDAELFDEPGQERIRDWIKWISETVAALPAPEPVGRAAVLEEAAQIAVAENQSCPAVYQCQPCLTRERIAADLLRAAAKERPAVAEQPDTQTREARHCPAKHGALGRICKLPLGHAGMHTGSGPNGGAVWDGDAP